MMSQIELLKIKLSSVLKLKYNEVEIATFYFYLQTIEIAKTFTN